MAKGGSSSTSSHALDRKTIKNLLLSCIQNSTSLLSATISTYPLPPLDVLHGFKDARGRNALHYSCQSKSHDVIRYIIDVVRERQGTEKEKTMQVVNARDEDGVTPAMCLCMDAGDSQPSKASSSSISSSLKSMVSVGCDVTIKTKTGATALHYASGSGYLNAVTSILEAAGDDNSRAMCGGASEESGTPLHWSCVSGSSKSVEISRLLISKSPSSLNYPGGPHGLPPIVTSIASQDDRLSALLASSGSDVGHVLTGNVTLLHMSCDMCMVETTSAILKTKASNDLVAIENDKGETPLMLACLSGSRACVELLLRHSGDVTSSHDDVEVSRIVGAKVEQMKGLSEKLKDRRGRDAEGSDQSNRRDDTTETTEPSNDVKDDAQPSALSLLTSKLKTSYTTYKSSNPTRSSSSISSGSSHKLAGNARYKSKDYAAALSCYLEAMSADPYGDAAYYSNASACSYITGDYSGAAHHAATAVIIDPSYSKARYRLSTALLKMGEHEDAAVEAWECLRIDKGNEDAKRLVRRCVEEGRKERKGRKV